MIFLEGMASDILQLVVDMPEDEDLIWLAYQDEELNGDEEEARVMEVNEVQFTNPYFASSSIAS